MQAIGGMDDEIEKVKQSVHGRALIETSQQKATGEEIKKDFEDKISVVDFKSWKQRVSLNQPEKIELRFEAMKNKVYSSIRTAKPQASIKTIV